MQKEDQFSLVTSEIGVKTDIDREQLRLLARCHGIGVEYWDYQGKQQVVSDHTLISILGALGIAAKNSEEIKHSLQVHENSSWKQILPPTVVVRNGNWQDVYVHVPHGLQVRVYVREEDGGVCDLIQVDRWVEPREIEGLLVGEATFQIPASLPLGWHKIYAEIEDGQLGESTLIVVPQALEHHLLSTDSTPEKIRRQKPWGLMAQLYSVTSRQSWGVGDYADLADLMAIAAHNGADFVLINPLHAGDIVYPIEPSPYLPVSRDFTAPIYIRPHLILEAAQLGANDYKEVCACWEHANEVGNFIDRDRSWAARRGALELIFKIPRSVHRQLEFEDFKHRGGKKLADFGLWCALVEKFAGEFPAGYDHVDDYAVAQARTELADQSEFWVWLQWVGDMQLRYAQQVGKDLGMELGVMSDLAVGVHPFGADKWLSPGTFAKKITVGAPPDFYNQIGQNWSQPPWNPRELERCGYAPLREVVRKAVAHCGAVRIDHILGLFRLWWIPEGNSPAQGAYVHYDHEAMVGVILLEAQRAQAMVIGEDLGTVEPWVSDYLDSRGILGTQVLWFEKNEDGTPKERDHYRQRALATINTHDLPPSAGYLNEIHVDLRSELGLLKVPVEQVREEARREREAVLTKLTEYGLLTPEQYENEEEVIVALHQYLAGSPALLFGVSLVDAVGERRVQNQPGTHREYPNWCVPLGDETGQNLTLEDLVENPRAKNLFNAVSKLRPKC